MSTAYTNNTAEKWQGKPHVSAHRIITAIGEMERDLIICMKDSRMETE